MSMNRWVRLLILTTIYLFGLVLGLMLLSWMIECRPVKAESARESKYEDPRFYGEDAVRVKWNGDIEVDRWVGDKYVVVLKRKARQ
jgi:hypothetical protein